MLDKELPENPLPMFKLWTDQAWQQANVPNPNAMVVCSVDDNADQPRPSARVVLMKGFNDSLGYVVFYTNFESRKGKELLSNRRASAVLFWDHLGRQVRLEGPIVQSPESESDEYFQSRPRASQIGAWTSQQSQQIDSRQALMDQLETQEHRFANPSDIPRPPHWGGFRLWIEHIELWNNGEHRLHDRAVWTRQLPSADDLITSCVTREDIGTEWMVQRLQP